METDRRPEASFKELPGFDLVSKVSSSAFRLMSFSPVVKTSRLEVEIPRNLQESSIFRVNVPLSS